MLPTQISYWNNKENQRHNLVTEKQNLEDLERRRDELSLSYKRLQEDVRHNKQQEKISGKSADAAIEQARIAEMRLLNDIKLTNAQIQETSAKINLLGTQSAYYKAQTNLSQQKEKTERASRRNIRANTEYREKESQWFWVTQVATPMVKGLSGLTTAISAGL